MSFLASFFLLVPPSLLQVLLFRPPIISLCVVSPTFLRSYRKPTGFFQRIRFSPPLKPCVHSVSSSFLIQDPKSFSSFHVCRFSPSVFPLAELTLPFFFNAAGRGILPRNACFYGHARSFSPFLHCQLGGTRITQQLRNSGLP